MNIQKMRKTHFIAAPNVFETDPTAPRNIFRHWQLRWPGSASPATVRAMIYESFCGGIFETNCYLVQAPEGWILFDAPDGACDWLDSRQLDLKLLLLTHGHIDHVQDVAKIKRRFNCPIGCHPITAPMIS